jgi:hypothetical protein
VAQKAKQRGVNMDESTTRVRINFTTREFEIQGSEAFVREYVKNFEGLFHIPVALDNKIKPSNGNQSQQVTPITASNLPASFGEYLHEFDNVTTDVDRMLIAGNFAQSSNSDRTFTTSQARELLEEQGIKPSNPTDCIAKAKKAKKVIVITKGNFRMSHTGEEYIKTLRNAG